MFILSQCPGRGLARIDYRMEWEDAFRSYVNKLDEKKPVIICGDLNIAHQEIDLKNPKSNRGNAGGFPMRRGSKNFLSFLKQVFTPILSVTSILTWKSLYVVTYRFNARANNAGWRIDYL